MYLSVEKKVPGEREEVKFIRCIRSGIGYARDRDGDLLNFSPTILKILIRLL